MKNIHVERLRIAAKQFHRYQRRQHFDKGIHAYHLYDGLDPACLSWWDDVAFILNDYMVVLLWIHPRMAYDDQIDSVAHKLSESFPQHDILINKSPVHQKIGRSRKKLIRWESECMPKSDYLETLDATKKHLALTSDIQVVPFVKSSWIDRYRMVKLCAPVEVRNEVDLRSLATLAKRLLKHEVTLQELFPNYHYTKMEWEQDGLNTNGTYLHSHRMR